MLAFVIGCMSCDSLCLYKGPMRSTNHATLPQCLLFVHPHCSESQVDDNVSRRERHEVQTHATCTCISPPDLDSHSPKHRSVRRLELPCETWSASRVTVRSITFSCACTLPFTRGRPELRVLLTLSFCLLLSVHSTAWVSYSRHDVQYHT